MMINTIRQTIIVAMFVFVVVVSFLQFEQQYHHVLPNNESHNNNNNNNHNHHHSSSSRIMLGGGTFPSQKFFCYGYQGVIIPQRQKYSRNYMKYNNNNNNVLRKSATSFILDTTITTKTSHSRLWGWNHNNNHYSRNKKSRSNSKNGFVLMDSSTSGNSMSSSSNNNDNEKDNESSFTSDDDTYQRQKQQQEEFDRQRLIEEEKKIVEQERMMNIRSIQESFYKTVSSSQIQAITNTLEEECTGGGGSGSSSSQTTNVETNDINDDTIELIVENEECYLLDTDSPEAILEVHTSAAAVEKGNEETFSLPKMKKEKLLQTTQCHYDRTTGTIHHLPLWRVQWTELPGRTNVLSIHEPMYTNMFEEIIRSSGSSHGPWYVGHLYQPNGSASVVRPQEKKKVDDAGSIGSEYDKDDDTNSRCELVPWSVQAQRNVLYGENIADVYYPVNDEAAVIGTLLQITDYRRFHDGKLLLFVQGISRFVVTDVQQTFPYGVATVQLLPDIEEMKIFTTTSPTTTIILEQQSDEYVTPYRIEAIQNTMELYKDYEFNKTSLPLPQKKYISISDMTIGSTLMKLIPFVSYSNNHPNNNKDLNDQVYNTKDDDDQVITPLTPSPTSSTLLQNNHSPCLEVQLLNTGIMKEPYLLQKNSFMDLSIHELETRLWIALDEYAKMTRSPIPMLLLELLPHGTKWPKKKKRTTTSSSSSSATTTNLPSDSTTSTSSSSFVLDDIVRTIEMQVKCNLLGQGCQFNRLSKEYPTYRRQQRLSYHAAQLLEKQYRRQDDNNTNGGGVGGGGDHTNSMDINMFRQQLLRTISTKKRLAYVTQLFECQEDAFE